MNGHSLYELVLRAVPLVVIALAAALTIRKLRRNPLAWGGLFAANLSGLCVEDQALEARLVAVLQERRKIEAIPASVKVLGIAWACACIGALGAGVAGVFSAAQLPLWYAAMCLALAGIVMHAYFGIRNTQPIRVAVVQARSSAAVIPPQWFAAACAYAALVLIFSAHPATRIAALLVCGSSLITMAIAWQLTKLPARLAGNDIEAERFVDEGLRFRRAAKVLLIGILQPYLFVCLQLRDATTADMAAWVLSMMVLMTFMVWMARQLRRQPVLNGAAV